VSQYSSFAEEAVTPGAMSPEEMERAQHLYEDILLQTDSSRVVGRIARTYAEALLATAEKQGQAVSIAQQFQSLGKDLFATVPGLEGFLTSQSVSRKRRDAALVQLFDGRATPLFLDFLRLLNRKDRLGLLRLIAIAYRSLRDNQANRQRILVEAAAPLAPDQQTALEATLAELTGKTPVLVVRVGDRVYDTSVRTRLDNIRNHLMASGTYGS
jgi:F-type H+-transporting ATPase subunit delta